MSEHRPARSDFTSVPTSTMPTMFTPEDLALMQRVRAVFDPQSLCNPGKVFPTPRLCGEVPGPYRRHHAEVAGLAERM